MSETRSNIGQDSWNSIVLDYEDRLEDMVSAIADYRATKGESASMKGNAVILKEVSGGCVILSDDGDKMYLPYNNYKGRNHSSGTRIQYGKTMKRGGKTICLDAMECVDFSELKYRLFTSIEDGDMVIAATSAWAIYDGAPTELREQMKACVHSMRNKFKEQRKRLSA